MNLPSLSFGAKLGAMDFGKVQTVFAPAGAVIISLVVLVFVIWPKFGQTLSTRSENGQLESRITLLSEKVQILESLDKNLLDQQLIAAERLLPSDKAVFTFVRQVETSASASGVALSKVDIAPGSVSASTQTTAGASPAPAPGGSAATGASGESADMASKIQVKVSMSSDYKSLVNFIDRMSTLARISAVKDLTVASTSATRESAPIRSTLVLDAYFRALPVELGSIESPIEQLTEEEEKILTRVRQVVISEPVVLPSAAPVSGGRSDLFAPF